MQASHWSARPKAGRAVDAERTQGSHSSLASTHLGQSHKTWASVSGPVSGGDSLHSRMAWRSTCVAPGTRATLASQV